MGRFLRKRVAGGTYFFTVVSHERRPILTTKLGRECLRAAIDLARSRWPFRIIAVVLLPDHLHTVWELPTGDANYSIRWQKIKEHFTRAFLTQGGREGATETSRKRKQERAIWQRRFWEHTCSDEGDLKRCVDYLHWNPVKHGIVSRVVDYPWSTFHRFVRSGEYDVGWGGANPCPGLELPE
jgi:REP-associated tyrosine transposase